MNWQQITGGIAGTLLLGGGSTAATFQALGTPLQEAKKEETNYTFLVEGKSFTIACPNNSRPTDTGTLDGNRKLVVSIGCEKKDLKNNLDWDGFIRYKKPRCTLDQKTNTYSCTYNGSPNFKETTLPRLWGDLTSTKVIQFW
ncbi:hypothetical protein MHLP_03070 [Candidatus Mycoplasma haematolamae str. Purdue]|uniref:Uncharacterized protein n=1 Tax=Mycoplasma haematolamae (strain Purdue) TaxID=1212765 RepID=I7CJY8_MYCHA|nr:hypothetical protein [Candidatus Mycoplasma haematolamae]AFO52194.1 hypothetical protein MHLP_03070 [Candidatus Mycoplasma haematolamae str. Purdue]